MGCEGAAVASTGNWVVVSLLTLVATITFLSPETAQAAGRAIKKRAHVTVKPLVTLRNRPQTALVTVRKGHVQRVSSLVEIQPARPSFGQLHGLHRATDALDLKSGVALILDQDTNEVLFSKNSQAVLPIASLTKLMTALVVTEANQPLDEMLTVTEDDIDTEKGSRSRLRVGTVLRREEMLHLALMSSENRAANALGRHFPGGLNAFVASMNRKALELGMNDTQYVEPTGLSSRNQSSARDLATLVKAAHEHQIIRELSTSPEFQFEIGHRALQFRNTNNLVRSSAWDIGLQKTGYISEAGRCLVMQVKMAGRKLIMVFLDSAGKYSRIGDAERVRRWVNESAQHAIPNVVPAAVPAELPATGAIPKLTS
jgi:serine-type D-Ala-D-Ala endopeptidase (penicillin-binding protein 7)